MTVLRATLRVRRDGRTVTFQVEGIARMADGIVLRGAGEQALADGAELRLAWTCAAVPTWTAPSSARSWSSSEPSIASAVGATPLFPPRRRCCQLLRQMGLDCVCTIVEEDGTGDGRPDRTTDRGARDRRLQE